MKIFKVPEAWSASFIFVSTGIWYERHQIESKKFEFLCPGPTLELRLCECQVDTQDSTVQ